MTCYQKVEMSFDCQKMTNCQWPCDGLKKDSKCKAIQTVFSGSCEVWICEQNGSGTAPLQPSLHVTGPPEEIEAKILPVLSPETSTSLAPALETSSQDMSAVEDHSKEVNPLEVLDMNIIMLCIASFNFFVGVLS